MTNLTFESSPEDRRNPAPPLRSLSGASPVETLAYTCAVDLCGETPEALALARDFLKDVRKSGLRPPFSHALLRRLALAEWTKLDRPRPSRLDSKDPKESAILVFFLNAWDATYEDLAVALSASEDRARHLVHKARMEQIGTTTRIPIPKPECRRPRELLSDFREGLLSPPLAEDVAQHLRECRECTTLDRHLQAILSAPARLPLEPPPELVSPRPARPTLSLSLDGVSRAKRRAGIVLMSLGVVMGALQFHPGLNASASAQMDRMGATLSRWRGRGERLMEDLRVLKALAIGTVEGRTEELSQTLDEYVNSGNAPETSNAKNKPAPDAVLDSREPKATPRNQQSPRPAEGSQAPSNLK